MTLDLITRAEWGAKHPSARPGLFRRAEAVCHTEAGAFVPEWWSLADFCKRIRQIEDFHTRPKAQGGRGWDAIAYSFLIDPVNGWVAEGRGFGQNGTHTQQGRNSSAYAFCFLGNGDNQAVSEVGWQAATDLTREGLRVGAIAREYVVTGHRNYAQKSCPGNLIYPEIGRLRGLTLDEEDDVQPKDVLKFAQATGQPVYLLNALDLTREGIETHEAREGIAKLYGIEPTVHKVHADVIAQHRERK